MSLGICDKCGIKYRLKYPTCHPYNELVCNCEPKKWCPYLIRRKGKTWLCHLYDDVCTHKHPASCTRYEEIQSSEQTTIEEVE